MANSAAKRIILITGANSGIGYDTADLLARSSSNNHVILACRDPTRGSQALSALQARNPAGSLSLLQLDVTDDATITAAVEKITADFAVLDVLVNNAGRILTTGRGLTDSRREEMLLTINTNAIGAVVLTEALLPLLKKSNDPRVINVSSMIGSLTERGDPKSEGYEGSWIPYRMSKAALNMATVCLQVEHGGEGLKVWSYCPGWAVTNLTGPEEIQLRIDNGAISAAESAAGLVKIVEGKRDGEVGLFVARSEGKRWDW